MSLRKYKEKRNFKKTSEPKGKKKAVKDALIFVVQKHHATSLHYDFRLELDGVLKSWAVPKGPSLNPADKKLAMMVEDHPFDYKDFEGVIPEGNYGAGNVIVWDHGTYHSIESEDKKKSIPVLRKGLEKGDLKFILHGKKLKGEFVLVRMKTKQPNAWLLIKKKDQFVSEDDILEKEKSVISGLTVDEIGEEKVKKKVRISKSSIDKEFRGAVKKKMQRDVKPMLAELSNKIFNDKNWLFEIKWDGYRAIAEIEKGEVSLHSRNNVSFNDKYPSVVKSLRMLDADIVLDGEVAVVDDFGKSSFQLLQNFRKTGKGNLIYFVFDILYLNGYDLTSLPLLRRKEILKKILPDIPNITFSDHVIGEGKEFFKIAEQRGLEGIIAKRTGSKYLVGKRSKEWLKIKTRQHQEAVICGFTQPRGSRNKFGSLVLGTYDEGELIYIGQAGTGFTDTDLNEIYLKLKPDITKTPQFSHKIETNAPVTWVKPKYICEVEFSEWTEEGLMRMPVFIRLRDDKELKDIVNEEAADDNDDPIDKNSVNKEIKINGNKLKLTNLDKIYFPAEEYTKGDIIEYYRKISEYILPYLKGRPESLNRHPNGIEGESFYQKDMASLPPDWVKTAKIYSEHNEKEITYLVCNDEASLVYMANLGCIEINPWFSRIENPENPDYCVLDLDPEDISFDKVIETALTVKEVLNIAGAESYCKTSGATGLHIYIPLNAEYTYNVSRDFAHLIAQLVYQRIPDITSIKRNPSKRQKKVYLDYLQNRVGQTLAAPYSIRPRPGAPVSTPLKWNEVKIGLDPKDFNIKNIFKRLDKRGDIFKDVLGKGIDITECISRLEEYAKKSKRK
jgi:bifunctional non-homologous end joining protein LigD